MGKALDMGDSLKAAKELGQRIANVWDITKRVVSEWRHPALRNKQAFGVPLSPKEAKVRSIATFSTGMFSKRNLYDSVVRPLGWAVEKGVQSGAWALGKLKSTMSTAGRMAGIAAVAGLGLTLYQLQQKTVDVAHNIVTYDRFAVSINSSTHEVLGLIGKMKALGEEADVVFRALHNIQDLKLAVQFKDRGATALFKDLNIDPNGLWKDVAQNFDVITSAINKEQDELTRLSMAYRVFGEDAAKILKLSTLNQLGLGPAAGGLQKGMNPETASMFYEAQKMVSVISARIEGMTARFLTTVGPMIMQILSAVETAASGLSGDNGTKFFRSAMLQIQSIIDFFMALPTYMSYGTAAIKYSIAEIVIAVNELTAVIGNLGNILTRFTFDTNKPLQRNIEWAKTSKKAKEDMDAFGIKLMEKEKNGINKESFIERALNNKPTFDLYSRMSGLLRLYGPLLAKAKEYSKAATHPFETFKTELRELEAMRASKMLDPTAFGRTFMRMVGDAERNMNAIDIRLPSAAGRDSAEGLSAINRSEVEHRLTNANTPMERMRRGIEIGNERLSVIEENTRRTAEEISKNPDLIRIP